MSLSQPFASDEQGRLLPHCATLQDAMEKVTNRLACALAFGRMAMYDGMANDRTNQTRTTDEIAAYNLNTKIAKTEFLARLGEFFLTWQQVEVAIQAVCVRAAGRNIEDRHEAWDKRHTRLENKSNRVIQQLDMKLYQRLGNMREHRNYLTHNALLFGHGGNPYKPSDDGLFVPDGAITDAALAASIQTMGGDTENGDQTTIVISAKARSYRAEAITNLTWEARAIRDELLQWAAVPDLFEQFQKETASTRKKKPSRRQRRRGKTKQ